MFAKLGAHLLQADKLAHELMTPGQPVYDEVVRRFGQEIVQSDGTINREKLAEIAFGQGRIGELNQVVHPAVIQRQEQWMAELTARDHKAVIMVEAALIFEVGIHRRFDKLVVVAAGAEQKKQRFAERVLSQAALSDPAKLAAATGDAERRMATQVPDAQKIESADYVIDNSGGLEKTREQVLHIWRELEALAASKSD
jgi:dephospho-CoA kinase